ncbi:MAG: hypothetical protein M3065_00935 [Actinomycetota bacterium]|nr:hypothetical protein [Actinomycetota bacterium]
MPLARRVAGQRTAVLPTGVLLAAARDSSLWLFEEEEEEVPHAGARV